MFITVKQGGLRLVGMQETTQSNSLCLLVTEEELVIKQVIFKVAAHCVKALLERDV